MYLGKIVELGTVEDIFNNTAHPYTIALLSARPTVSHEKKIEKIILEGEIPSPSNPPSGCFFNPRCNYRTDDKPCNTEFPPRIDLSDTHSVRCWNWDDRYKD
jgi:oligopeptide/dipeptide ABC transporter ATP-binding protein